jgi:hypothetical protein
MPPARGRDRGADERLVSCPAETEIIVAAAGGELVRGQVRAELPDQRDEPLAGVGLGVLLAFDLVPAVLDPDHVGDEVDVTPPQRADLSDPNPGEEQSCP